MRSCDVSVAQMGRSTFGALVALGLLAGSGVARAQGESCDQVGGNGLTPYLSNVPPYDQDAAAIFEETIRATGTLYECGYGHNPGQFFYPPSDLGSGPPGTVLRTRPVFPSPAGPDTWAVKIMYKTERRIYNPAGGYVTQPVAATGTIIFRRDREPDTDILVFNHGTAGIAASCVYLNDYAQFYLVDAVEALFDRYLAPDTNTVLGFTDYIGFGAVVPGLEFHTYLVAADQARATIDFAAAIHNLAEVTGAGTRWVVTGHSQGGQSAALAAEYEAEFNDGRDMTLIASVPMSAPGDMPATVVGMQRAHNTSPSGSYTGNTLIFLAAAAYGYQGAYPHLNPADVINPLSPGYWWGYWSWYYGWVPYFVPTQEPPVTTIRRLFQNGDSASEYFNMAVLQGYLPNVLAGRTPPNWVIQADLTQDPVYGAWLVANYGIPISGTPANANPAWGNAPSAFSLAQPDRNIVGCSYETVTGVLNWMRGSVYSQWQVSRSLETPSWPTATSGLGYQLRAPNGIAAQNSVGLQTSDAPILSVVGNCDDLMAITLPGFGQVGNPCDFAFGGTRPYPLGAEHPAGPPLTAFEDQCAAGSAVTLRIYGDLDYDGDGVLDQTAEYGGGGFNHGSYLSGPQLGVVLDEIDAFVADAATGSAPTNCP